MDDYEDRIARLIDMAYTNEVVMDGTYGPWREIIGNSDVVIGFWPDASMPQGHDFEVIKGKPRLRAAIARGRAELLWVNAILCECAEEALAAQQVLGDGH